MSTPVSYESSFAQPHIVLQPLPSISILIFFSVLNLMQYPVTLALPRFSIAVRAKYVLSLLNQGYRLSSCCVCAQPNLVKLSGCSINIFYY